METKEIYESNKQKDEPIEKLFDLIVTKDSDIVETSEVVKKKLFNYCYDYFIKREEYEKCSKLKIMEKELCLV